MTGASYEATEALAKRLHRNIEVYRPVLLDGKDCNALWISQRGTQLSAMAIYKRICRRTGDYFDTHHVSLRGIRKAGLSQFAADLPEKADYMRVRGVHASDRVEDAHYNLGGSLAATARIQSALAHYYAPDFGPFTKNP